MNSEQRLATAFGDFFQKCRSIENRQLPAADSNWAHLQAARFFLDAVQSIKGFANITALEISESTVVTTQGLRPYNEVASDNILSRERIYQALQSLR